MKDENSPHYLFISWRITLPGYKQKWLTGTMKHSKVVQPSGPVKSQEYHENDTNMTQS